MAAPIPDIDAGRNRVSGEISLIHKCALIEDGVYIGNTAWGSIETFNEIQFADIGLTVVLRSLKEFSGRSSDVASEFELLGADGKKVFLVKHQIVGISVQESGDLWLDPVHHKNIGLSGFSDPNERVVVAPTLTSQHEFLEVLQSCFEMAD